LGPPDAAEAVRRPEERMDADGTDCDLKRRPFCELNSQPENDE